MRPIPSGAHSLSRRRAMSQYFFLCVAGPIMNALHSSGGGGSRRTHKKPILIIDSNGKYVMEELRLPSSAPRQPGQHSDRRNERECINIVAYKRALKMNSVGRFHNLTALLLFSHSLRIAPQAKVQLNSAHMVSTVRSMRFAPDDDDAVPAKTTTPLAPQNHICMCMFIYSSSTFSVQRFQTPRERVFNL